MSDDEESTSIKTESQVKSGKMALVRSGGGDESTDEVETASEMRTTDVLSDDMPSMSRSRSKATSDTKGGGGKSTRRLSFENDSFKKFTSDMIDKYMQEEAMRSRHQAHLLKLRERALVEKTNAELAWIEQMKKKALDKGQDDRMPSMLAKEKGIMSKLKREQANIDRLKAAQRKEAQNRLGVLTQHAEVIKWCQDKLKKIRAARKDGGGGDVESDEIKSEIDNSVEDEDNEDDDTNRSLIEDKVLKQVKKQLESEKYYYYY